MSNTKAVLFDLDGTLLPIDVNDFTGKYFKYITKYAASRAPELLPDLISNMMQACDEAIRADDGLETVSEVFWREFIRRAGGDENKYKSDFDEYYQNHYAAMRQHAGFSGKIPQAVELCKRKGMLRCVATNPIFPIEPILQRISWAGLDPADFALITDYETMHFAKPNVKYYEEIARILGVRTQECAMVGNNGIEDMVAADVGMKTFLLHGFEFDHDGYCGEQGGYDALLDWLGKL